MPRLSLYMAMSLDGFITGPDDGKNDPNSRMVFDESMSTGAVLTGRPIGELPFRVIHAAA